MINNKIFKNFKYKMNLKIFNQIVYKFTKTIIKLNLIKFKLKIVQMKTIEIKEKNSHLQEISNIFKINFNLKKKIINKVNTNKYNYKIKIYINKKKININK